MATTKSFPIRLTPDEYAALKAVGEASGQSAHALLVAAVRQIVDAGPALLKDDLGDLSRAVAEVHAIGRNLNQLTRAVHQGKAGQLRVDGAFLKQCAERVDGIRREIDGIAARQHARWVPLKKAPDKSP